MQDFEVLGVYKPLFWGKLEPIENAGFEIVSVFRKIAALFFIGPLHKLAVVCEAKRQLWSALQKTFVTLI